MHISEAIVSYACHAQKLAGVSPVSSIAYADHIPGVSLSNIRWRCLPASSTTTEYAVPVASVHSATILVTAIGSDDGIHTFIGSLTPL